MAATTERILEAALEAFLARPYDEVTLRDVAGRAAVSYQTVLRRFGSKDGLLAATAAWVAAGEEARRRATPGDARAVARALVRRYEEIGDANVRFLAFEERSPAVHDVLEQGRRGHRGWLERHFAAALEAAGEAGRERLLALLYAATDVGTWKLWRRDLGLSRRQTELAMAELLELLIAGVEREKEES